MIYKYIQIRDGTNERKQRNEKERAKHEDHEQEMFGNGSEETGRKLTGKEGNEHFGKERKLKERAGKGWKGKLRK